MLFGADSCRTSSTTARCLAGRNDGRAPNVEVSLALDEPAFFEILYRSLKELRG